jgi:hypothetical protein
MTATHKALGIEGPFSCALTRSRRPLEGGGLGGGGGGVPPPPGVLATGIARAPVVQVGRRCPAVKRECPAPRHRAGPAVQPFVLDRLPGTRPAGH